MMRAHYRAAIQAAQVSWSGRSARWGVDDCAMALADIHRTVQGIDPLAEYRGRYASEEEAQALMGREGLTGVWARAARALGWARIGKPHFSEAQDGDQAVVVGPAGIVSAIRLGRFWIGRADRGDFAVMDKGVLRAWRVI